MLAILLGDLLAKVKKKSIELDVVSHSLVPEMKVLNEKQKEAIFEKYGIKGDQFPKILPTDAEVVALGAKSGHLILIKRKDEPGSYDSYRSVL